MFMQAIKQNLSLSLPILCTRLIGVASNLIAMIFVARLGTTALSASALVSSIFSLCFLVVLAFSFPVCALIAVANGGQKPAAVGHILFASLVLNSALALPCLIFFWHIDHVLIFLHQSSAIATCVASYFHGLCFGYLPMIWAAIFEQFFIAIQRPRYLISLSIFSLALMPLLSQWLIFGGFGLSAHGMFGAGLAMSLTSLIGIVVIFSLILSQGLHERYHLFSARLEMQLIKKLYQLGWPIALQYGIEFTAYVVINVMTGWIGVIALAAQQMMMQFTSIIVMLPTSLAQATTALVAQALGKKDSLTIQSHVKAAICLALASMGCIAVSLIIFPGIFIHVYLPKTNSQYALIYPLAKTLLLILAISQCFDALKNVLIGAYRGVQESKLPMWLNSSALWLLSIPLAYYFGFIQHWGAVGIRFGFSIGVAVATIVLIYKWLDYRGIGVLHAHKQTLS